MGSCQVAHSEILYLRLHSASTLAALPNFIVWLSACDKRGWHVQVGAAECGGHDVHLWSGRPDDPGLGLGPAALPAHPGPAHRQRLDPGSRPLFLHPPLWRP